MEGFKIFNKKIKTSIDILGVLWYYNTTNIRPFRLFKGED